jgi:hypothetical protein
MNLGEVLLFATILPQALLMFTLSSRISKGANMSQIWSDNVLELPRYLVFFAWNLSMSNFCITHLPLGSISIAFATTSSDQWYNQFIQKYRMSWTSSLSRRNQSNCLKSSVFWDITHGNLMKVSRCFGETYHLQCRSWRVNKVGNQHPLLAGFLRGLS